MEEGRTGVGVTDTLKEKFPNSIIGGHSFRGDETIVIKKEDVLQVCKFLRDGMGFNFLMDLTAVDYLNFPEGSTDKKHGLRLSIIYIL
jgi:NADH:ubiquinone oxidoreductase subunit C